MSAVQTIIVTGSPNDGYQFIGPFDSPEDATEFADQEVKDSWWLSHIETPEGYKESR